MQGSCLVHNVLRFKELRHIYIVIKEQIKKIKKNKEKVQIDTSFHHTSSNLYVIFFFFKEFPEPSVQG